MGKLTARIAKELIAHEGIVPEAYKDSKGIWTWSVGITNASGHIVDPRYIDHPQTLERCIEIYLWLLAVKYIPPVDAAFKGFKLSEAQFGAALSFHYNTGAIGGAEWVTRWKEGKTGAAKTAIMNWKNPPEVLSRRTKERDLFFDGKWAGKGKSLVYSVSKPSYQPVKARSVDVSTIIDRLLP
jgi:lysozyme